MIKTRFANSKSKAHPGRGFTLIEVMISGALLVIGITAMILAVGAGHNIYLHQRQLTKAIQVAELTLEDFLLLNKNDDDLTPGQHTACFDTLKGRRIDGQNCDNMMVDNPRYYKLSWQVDLHRPVTNIRYIKLVLEWMEKKPKKTTFITYRD